MTRWTLHHADCRDAMRAMAAESVDAIVTDPPYGLSFMGKGWDHGVPGVPFWTEALRVAKPGAHLLAFGGTRTFHRLTCAIEDAGWEVRDCLSWLYGSGFPKSLDVSKAIDKAAGAEREVVGVREEYAARANKKPHSNGSTVGGFANPHDVGVVTAPATDAARAWYGWGTALKPAWEPIILARKPLVGTVAANVIAHGTGAINVDACRVEGLVLDSERRTSRSGGAEGRSFFYGLKATEGERHSANGRWPANVALDEEAAAMLDEQSGQRKPGERPAIRNATMGYGGDAGTYSGTRIVFDSGGASRFFYTAKASRRERGEGNTHPTVKPLALMRWLVRLVTPPGGLVLDPFSGSGSTGVAALSEGMRYVGCEREAEYVEISRRRLESSHAQMELL